MNRSIWVLAIAASLSFPSFASAESKKCQVDQTGLTKQVLDQTQMLQVGFWPAVSACQAWAVIDEDTIYYAWGPYLSFPAGMERHKIKTADVGSFTIQTSWGATITLFRDGRTSYEDTTTNGLLWGEVKQMMVVK